MCNELKKTEAVECRVYWGRRIGLLAILLTALGDFLFVGHPVGWTVGLFWASVLAVVLADRAVTRIPKGVLYTFITGCLLLCLRCIYVPNILSMLLLPLGILTIALARREGWVADAWQWSRRWYTALTKGWLESVMSLLSSIASIGSRRRNGGRRMGLRLWGIPILLGVIFVGLFAIANPVIGRAFEQLFSAFPRITNPLSLLKHISFWVVVLPLIGLFLGCVKRVLPVTEPESECEPLNGSAETLKPSMPDGMIRRALILFNVIFLIQTVLDMIYLWGGAALPSGMTYAEYAHRGAYPLVVAALLAGGFAIVAFPSGTRISSLINRRLVYLWLAQTVLLVVSSAWRLWLYVGVYALSRLRFAAGIWMLLVAAGLISIIIRIARSRSTTWLVNVNALFVVLALFLCAMMGMNAHIANFNVRHSQESLGPGHEELDSEYLKHLGTDALPAIYWIIEKYPDHPNSDAWWQTLYLLEDQLFVQRANWRGWNYRNHIIYKELSNIIYNDKEAHFERIDGDRMHFLEHEPDSDITHKVTYRVAPSTVEQLKDAFQDLSRGCPASVAYKQIGSERKAVGFGITLRSYDDKDKCPAAATNGTSLTTEDCTMVAEDEFTFGRVVSTTSNTVTISEYDFTKDIAFDMTYKIKPETEFGNINDLSDLRVGDGITLYYGQEGDQRIITSLELDESEENNTENSQTPIESAPPSFPKNPYTKMLPEDTMELVITGRVLSLDPGRLVVEEFIGTENTPTEKAYKVSRTAKLYGYSSLSDLQYKQRITYRSVLVEGQLPTIVELAAPGHVVSNASATQSKHEPPPLILSGVYPHPFAIRKEPRAPAHVQTFNRGSKEEVFVDLVQSNMLVAGAIANEMLLTFMYEGESKDYYDITEMAGEAATDMRQLYPDLQSVRPPEECRELSLATLKLLREMTAFYSAASKDDKYEAYEAMLKAQNAYSEYVTAQVSIQFKPDTSPDLMRQLMTNDVTALVQEAVGPGKSMEIDWSKATDADDELFTTEAIFEYAHRVDPYVIGLRKLFSSDKYSPHLASLYLKWRTKMQSGYFGMSNWSEIPNDQYNQVRFQTLATVKAYLRDHPNDVIALAQKDFLLYLPNISRGGFFGNDNMFY